jgi:HSP20 family protein
MTWDKKKKRGWFDVFDEFDEKFDQLVDEMFKSFNLEEADRESKKKYGPYVYGFSITVSPDGKPEIREFGNVRKTEQGRIISDVREPLIDVMDRGTEVIVIAELPGVKKEDIRLSGRKNELRLSVGSSEVKYERVISIPPNADTQSMSVRYNNGILEIRLKKK